MNTAAIVLAAGAGTRMKSKKPKVAHEILGKPLVRWVVDAAREAGADRIVSVVGHAREIVEPLVSDTEVVVQKAQRGTADAVAACKEALAGFDGSLLVLSGDCPLITPDTIRELADMRARSNAAVVVLTMGASTTRSAMGASSATARGASSALSSRRMRTPPRPPSLNAIPASTASTRRRFSRRSNRWAATTRRASST